MARITLEGLSKTFVGPAGERIDAVRDVNLTIEEREFLVLVGPSGCGKSTLLRLIAGLEELSGGMISIDGGIVNSVSPKDRDVAMVFQNHALYPHMTIYENLAFALRLRKVPRKEIDLRVREVAEMLGVTPFLKRLPKALSGGERQRVAVGRAIVRQPRAFLLDEPLSNLDAQMRVQMRMELSRLQQRLQTTTVYVTHDQAEAMTLGHRIAVMHAGRIQQVAAPDTIYRLPANRFVAGFIGTPPMNFFAGRLSRSTNGWKFLQETMRNGAGEALSCHWSDEWMASRELALSDGRVVLGVRPEDTKLVVNTDETVVGHATVEWVESLGAERHVYLDSAGQTIIVRTAPSIQLDPGQRVGLSLNAANIHFFDPSTEARLGQKK